MKSWIVTLALLTSAGEAMAATEAQTRLIQLEAAPEACAAPPGRQGKPLILEATLDADAQAALAAGTYLALHDSTGADAWPVDVIAAAKPCSLARFEAGGAVLTMSGGDGRLPARWIRRPGVEGFFYLARGPAPADALAWSRTRQGLPPATAPAAYYLAVHGGGEHYLYQIYDDLPDTQRLADDVADLLEASRPPLAVLSAGDAVTVFRDTTSGVYAELFRPAAITPQRPAQLYGPDGRFFAGPIDQGWTLRGSGHACPPALGKYERARAVVLRPQDEDLDLSCGYETEQSLITLFFTRLPNVKNDKAYFAEQIAAAASELDKPRKLPDMPTGGKHPIQAGRAWVDSHDVMQEILFMRRGDYVVEFRASHILDDSEATGEALIKLIELVTPPGAER